jgi:ammonia channel protein AmtB
VFRKKREKAWNGVADGLLFGNPGQLFVQAVAVGVAILYSALGTFLLLKLVGLFIPVEKVYRIRTGEEDEAAVTPVQ